MFLKIILSLLFRSSPAPRAERPRQSSYTVKALSESALKIQIQDLPKVEVLTIIDGDTVLISKGWHNTTTVRLDAIDCPEDGQEWGDIAKYGLIKLIGGRRVHLEEHGIDSYGRTLATLHLWNEQKNIWVNVNEQMVMLGHAWVMRKFYDHLPKERQSKLNRLEQWAKSKKIGLWSGSNPIPPWQWRNLK
jgi:micrococcal nuclease